MARMTLYLECRSGSHHKFYRMIPVGNVEWTAEWGVIGKHTLGQKVYPIRLWDEKLAEKQKKGYEFAVDPSGTASNVHSNCDERYISCIELVLESLPDDLVGMWYSHRKKAEEIRNRYISTGILKRSDMMMLNETYELLKKNLLIHTPTVPRY